MAKNFCEVTAVKDDLEILRSTLQNIINKYNGRIISVTWSPTAKMAFEEGETIPQPGYVIVFEIPEI